MVVVAESRSDYVLGLVLVFAQLSIKTMDMHVERKV